MKKKLLFIILSLSLFSFTMYAKASKDEENESENVKITDADSSSLFDNAKVAMSQKDYLVTAGDVYSLAYSTGSSGVSYSIPVDATYKIRVANLAIIDCSGKTYLELKKQVEDIVTRNYPLSGVQFVLSSPSTFKITITGEVTETKEASAWALSRVSTFVNLNKTPYSSLHNVKVTSSDGKERSYDLYKAIRFGDMSQNPYVRPGDIITVPHVDRVVTISGAVERPEKYELMPGENLTTLINYYAGGLTTAANTKRIEISRVTSVKTLSGEKIYLEELKSDSDFELKNGDTVTIKTYSELRPVMFMEGAVGGLASGTALNTSSHIPVQFEHNTNYAYFIRNNAGLFKSSVSDNENAYIIRNKENIPLNINTVLYDLEYTTDLIVQENDILMVPFKQYFVSVSGAVRAPGRYPYIPDRTWDYYVKLAGGFTPQQNAFDAIEITDMDGHKHSKAEVITPEMRIHAKSNHITYILNQYGTLISLIASLVTSIIGLYQIFGKLI